MTDKQLDKILALTKCDLRILHALEDGYIKGKVYEAIGRMESEGARYSLRLPADLSFIASFAAWLYKSRDSDKGYPRWLRFELNNRCVGGDGRG